MVLNRRQVAEWAAEERLTPFESERADLRQALDTFWCRDAWLKDHDGKPSNYCLNFKGEEETTEAEFLMNEVLEIFSLG